MKVAITGATGLIGTALVAHLSAAGHDLVRLVRRPAQSPGEVSWYPPTGLLDPADLDGVEAVVNLAGAGVADRRWTPAYKQVILNSRIEATRTVVTAMTAMRTPPRVLVSASAQGFYGDRGDELLTETSNPGHGFLVEVVQQWEAQAQLAEAAGIRVALARTGLVMAPEGGAFGRLLPLIRLGLGGPLGSGQQWWSWITLADQVAALTHLITSDVSGPVNLCAPDPARNAELVRALGAALHRPTRLAVPAIALRVAVGGLVDDILSSTRMTPEVLQRSGFSFQHGDVATAAQWLTH